MYSDQIWTKFRSIVLLLNDWQVTFLISEIDLPLQLATVRLEQLQEVLLLQLPFYLLCLQLHWLGTGDGSHKIISLMFLVSLINEVSYHHLAYLVNIHLFFNFNAAEEDPEVHLGQLKRFSLRELQVATDNFSNKNILGKGGFGKVYKGRLADGNLVAVKRLKEERTQGGELQFQTEVEMISMAVHRNLLRLRGFCMTPTERLLVYPYMANGSVASCLRGNNLNILLCFYNLQLHLCQISELFFILFTVGRLITCPW